MSQGTAEPCCLAHMSPACTAAWGLLSRVQGGPVPGHPPTVACLVTPCPWEAPGSGLRVQTPPRLSGCWASHHLGDDATHGPHLPLPGSGGGPLPLSQDSV